jgi:hypothetical protein
MVLIARPAVNEFRLRMTPQAPALFLKRAGERKGEIFWSLLLREQLQRTLAQWVRTEVMVSVKQLFGIDRHGEALEISLRPDIRI